MGNQGKKIGFLCLLLIVSGGWIALPNATSRVWETLALTSRGGEAQGRGPDFGPSRASGSNDELRRAEAPGVSPPQPGVGASNAEFRVGEPLRNAKDRIGGPLPASSLVWNDPNLASSPGLHLGNGELFLRMMLSVGLVIALGAVALYLSRKVLPRVARASGKEIHVLETAYLGPRKALHLVEVSNQRLLIASANDSVTILSLVNEMWPGVPNAEFPVGGPLDPAQPKLGEAVKE
jgi:flagellar biogenesis protein FliO